MADYQRFMTKINSSLKIDLTYYKEAQMRRRLTSLMNKCGYTDFDKYYTALTTDEALLEEFLDRITINVTEFHRNPKRWEVLKEKILPALVKNKKSLTIWSAACSSGEEPYSIAMILKEHFPHVRAQIIATDLDGNILKKAQEGIFQPQSLKDLPSSKKSKYFTFKNNKYYIDSSLKRNITFKKHDLLKDRYPQNVDLIVCRNVLIYFTDEAKDLIYRRFSESLSTEGVLFVGSTEQIFNPQNYNYKLIDTFFYGKI